MHPKTFGALRLGLAAAFAAIVFTQTPAFAAEKPSAPQIHPAASLVETAKSSSVDVTVYGNSFAQVEETRGVKLTAGRNRIQLNGIAGQYRPDSLRVIDVKGPGSFSYKSATYQPANLSSERILADSVGQKVTATVGTGNAARQVSGTLAAFNGGQLVIKGDDGNTYLTGSGDVVLAALPAGLSNTASLVVEADVTADGVYDLHFLYETGGMTWSSKHSVVYDDEKQKLDSFETTVNVINESGTTFENATLWLLSGDVPPSYPKSAGLRTADYAAAAPEAANVQSVGERKVYRIPGTISLKDGQSRQIPLFSGTNVTVEREFFLPAESPYYYRGDAGGMTPVSVRLKVKNCVEHNLGMPLPAGVVKVYQRNNENRLQLTGTASVKELAKDEMFDLVIGTSSDIKAERTMTKATNIAGQPTGPNPNNVSEFQDQTFEVKIHNFKDKKDVDVVVEVSVPQDNKNVAPLTRKSATLATGTVRVDSGKSNTLSYTIRIRTR